MPNNEIVADVLEQAADLIETVGHSKRYARSYSKDGGFRVTGYCLSGAIYESSIFRQIYNSYGREDALVVFDFALRKVNEHLGSDAIMYNDREDTQPGQVIDLLKTVAKDLRNAQ